MKHLVALGLMLLFAASAVAQDDSRVEIFAGYQLFRTSPSSRVNLFTDQISSFGTNGGTGSVQFNVNSYIGLIGEFGGTRSGGLTIGTPSVALDQKQLLYLFGPRIFVHATSRVIPFAEFLIGGVHNSRTFDVPNANLTAGTTGSPGVSAEPGATTTRFHESEHALAAAVGMGVDINVSRRLSIRPFQLDYVGTHLAPVIVPGVPPGINDSKWQMNWKFATGVKFRFWGMPAQ
jgi:hypothetical protein